MHSHELEDLTLLLVRDADEAEMWIDRWALGYPAVRTAAASRRQNTADWQAAVQSAWDTIPEGGVAVTAHGAGVSAVLAWLYRADLATRRRVRNLILAAPRRDAFPDDAEHTLQRALCPCPAALVTGRDDPLCPPEWAAQLARRCRATPIAAPQTGRLNGTLQGWQWGMELMQEMLLA